jgi:LuxR family maltose regulon positive regulatory protein
MAREAPQIIGALTGELLNTVPDYCVLVLEDCQNIESSPLSRSALNLLLERAPDNCHIIISSRTPLALPSLNKLRLQRLAAETNMSHLAFTPSEAKNLLAELNGINLTDEEIEQLTAKTEGWIVGILLSSYSLRAGPPRGEALAISHQEVFRYLTSEVYDRQPPEVQSFLLASATLNQIEAEICDRLTGRCNTLQMLRLLEKDSMFVQCIDHDRALYRYHQIFREFLQRKLMEENTGEFLALHARAAAIFEEFGRRQEAIAHYLRARAYDETARLIKATAPDLIKTGKWGTVARWIEALPQSMRTDDGLALLYAQSMIYLGKADESIGILTAS